jgi:hypothetical protein
MKNFHHREEGEEGGRKKKKEEEFFTTENTEITEEEGIKLIFFLASVISVFSVVKNLNFLFFLPPLPLLCGENSFFKGYWLWGIGVRGYTGGQSFKINVCA